jgi:hypothetical protein
MRKESHSVLGGRNGYQLPPAQGSMQRQPQTITPPCWQHLQQQQQGVGVPAGMPAPSCGFGHFAETPCMQQLGMQQQQVVFGMPESNAGVGGVDAASTTLLQQRLDHLQEMQQQLEQLQSMMAAVQLKRQQAAALLDTADAAAAVAPGFGAGLQMPMVRKTTATQDAAAVEPAVGMGVGLQVPTLQRTLTLESSSNCFCACPTWASFVM